MLRPRRLTSVGRLLALHRLLALDGLILGRTLRDAWRLGVDELMLRLGRRAASVRLRRTQVGQPAPLIRPLGPRPRRPIRTLHGRTLHRRALHRRTRGYMARFFLARRGRCLGLPHAGVAAARRPERRRRAPWKLACRQPSNLWAYC